MTTQGTWIDSDDWELRDVSGYVVASATLSGSEAIVGSQYHCETLTLAQLTEYIDALTTIRDRMKDEQA